ncbi:MAG: PAS domain-containing protein, partial [Bacteroidota bacterium]
GIPDYFRFNANIYPGPDHSKIIVLAINDISDWCREKTALENENTTLREQVLFTNESAHLGTWEMDPATREITCDERCAKFFGNGERSLTYEDFLESLHPDDRTFTDEEIQKATSGVNHGLYNVEHRTQYKRTEQLSWLRANGKAYFDETGKATRFAGTVTDITLQKLNEQLLRESEERFRVAADAAAVLMWLSTPYKSRNYFNKSWLKYGGRNHQQESGFGWRENIHADDVEDYMKLYETNFDLQLEYNAEYRLRRKDGEYRWVAEVGAPRFSPAGIFEGFIGTCTDCHDQKRTREELENKVAERTQLLKNAISNLEASNQNLEEFAYVASHDLQEPLRKIQAFSDRLQHKNQHSLSDTTRLYLSKITGASDRMSHLIGDLLNYSKVKNTSELLETTDLNDVVQNVLSDFDLSIQQKKAVIHADHLPVIKAMPTRMNQLFHNLVSNSLKFAKEEVAPVISINSEKLGDAEKAKYSTLDSSTNYFVINFSDNGIGFNQEFAEKVFHIFQRLNGMSAYEGTGIGLAICRKIVLNHHGLIFAESKENVGTRFRIIFPAYEGEVEG